MSENGVYVRVDAQIDEATAAIAELKDSFASFSSEVKGHLEKVTTASDALLDKLKSMVEVFLSFEGAKKGVEVLKDMGVEAEKMAAKLGISQSDASRFAVAIDDVHGSADQFLGVMQRQSRQMRTNEDAMNSLGVKTRDASGQYLSQKEILLNSVEVLKQYKAGTDRNQAAMVLFGGRVGDLTAILKYSNEVQDEANKKADALGLTITEKNVKAVADWRKAENDLNDVMKATWKAIGEAVMPILTDLANWFAGVGKEAVQGFSVAVKVVASAFNGIVLVVQIVSDVVVGFVRGVTERLISLAEAAERAVHLDFAGAVVAYQRGTERMREAGQRTFDQMLDDAQKTKKRLDDLWNPDKTDAAAPKAGRSFRDPTTNADRAGDIDARIAIAKKGLEIETEYLKGEAAAKRITEVQKVDLVRQAAESEYQFERDLMLKKASLYANTPKEYQKALQEIDKLDAQHGLDIQKSAVERQAAEKKMRDESNKLQVDEIKHRAAMAEEGLKLESTYLDQQVELGHITAAKKLQIERNVLQSIYEYKRAELEREAALYANDPTQIQAYQKSMQDIEKLDASHQTVLQKNATDTTKAIKKEWTDVLTPITQAIETSVTGIVQGTITMHKALSNIWNSMLAEFTNRICKKMVDRWIEALTDMTTASGSSGIVGFFGSLLGISAPAAPAGAGGGSFSGLKLPSFDVGTPYVPNDMIAQIHKGERIIPAGQNYGTSGGVNFTMNIHTQDYSGFQRNQGEIMAQFGGMLGRAMRRNR